MQYWSTVFKAIDPSMVVDIFRGQPQLHNCFWLVLPNLIETNTAILPEKTVMLDLCLFLHSLIASWGMWG